MSLKHYIFADESSTAQSRFMLLGGIWVDECTYNQVKKEFKNFKNTNNWNEKTKFNWKSVSNKTLHAYKDFIDIFFKYNLKFNCIIIDKSIVNLKHNEEKNEELGFYKFYYQLLWHNSNKSYEYHVFLDRRNNKKDTRLSDLKRILRRQNISCFVDEEDYEDIEFLRDTKNVQPIINGINVLSLEAVDSKDYNLIQLTDILLGAISYHYNHRHLKKDASHNKIELANHIACNLNVKNLIFSTNNGGYKNFNIWLFKPRSEKASYDLHSPSFQGP